MSLYNCQGRFANDREMAQRCSVSREPQAMLACETLHRLQKQRIFFRLSPMAAGKISAFLYIKRCKT